METRLLAALGRGSDEFDAAGCRVSKGARMVGDAASSRVKFAALPKGVRRSATDKVK